MNTLVGLSEKLDKNVDNIVEKFEIDDNTTEKDFLKRFPDFNDETTIGDFFLWILKESFGFPDGYINKKIADFDDNDIEILIKMTDEFTVFTRN